MRRTWLITAVLTTAVAVALWAASAGPGGVTTATEATPEATEQPVDTGTPTETPTAVATETPTPNSSPTETAVPDSTPRELAPAAPAAVAVQPSFLFPWDDGAKVQFLSGPHKVSPKLACDRVTLSGTAGLDFGPAIRLSDQATISKFRVLAVAGGKVTDLNNTSDSGIGRYVKIDHGGGWATEYWHLSAVDSSISKGKWITAGHILGTAGETGFAYGVHLHVELKYNGVPQSWHGRTINGWRVRATMAGSASSGYTNNYLGTMTKGTESTASVKRCGRASTLWQGTRGTAVAAWNDANGDWDGTYLRSSNNAHR